MSNKQKIAGDNWELKNDTNTYKLILKVYDDRNKIELELDQETAADIIEQSRHAL